MKLFKHPDFRDAIIAAKEHLGHPGLTEQLIEKDYYVTEALRIVATKWPTQMIFKGGTSLSKGWGLIERFSEDIDLFLNRSAFTPPLSKNRVEQELKSLEEEVGDHPGLKLLPGGFSKRGVSRSSYFGYAQRFSGIAAVADRVLLEAGTRSGTYPTEEVLLSSYVAKFLRDTGNSIGAEDEPPFPMKLLHFRRTFVEKMFTIHSKVVKYRKDETTIGTYARHYYDLFCLAQCPEVQGMLRSDEYAQIKQDCDRISQEFFQDNYSSPKDMKFSKSEALFPTEELRKTLAIEYKEQCSNLCYGDYPQWGEIEACFEELREFL